MDGTLLNNLILNKDFDVAFKNIQTINNIEVLEKILIPFIYENPSIIYYGFISFVISQNNCSENHYLASVILVITLNNFLGSYDLAFYHAKKAVELSPQNISYQEFILLFYNIPEKLLKPTEALIFAKNIITIEPNNKTALNIIKALSK